jgi:hypothetical protein
MKTEKFSGEIENAYGKPLHELALKEGSTPLAKGSKLKYDASYNAYETAEEVKTGNDWPKDEDVVKFVNTQKKANARQKAMQAAQDAAGIIKPTLENDDQLKLKKMYDIFIAAKNTPDEARAKASAALGIDWASE